MTSIYQTLLSTGNYCLYNTGIAERIGRNESIALGIMCTLSSAYGDEWFPCPNELLMGALSFKSKHTVITIVENLMMLGIVDKYTENNDNYYRVDQERLDDLFGNDMKVDPIDLLASTSYQVYNLSIASYFESNIEAVVLATLTSYSRTYADKAGWFTAPEERIAEEICVKKRNIVRASVQKLIGEGLIETKKEGIPCRKYYRFIPQGMLDFLKRLQEKEGVQKGSNLLVQLCTKGCKKVPTIYIKGLFSSLRSKKDQAHFRESAPQDTENLVSEPEKMTSLIPEEVMNEYASAEELRLCARLFKRAGFNHRLPKEGEVPTKLLKEVIDDIRDIASGKFLDWQFDPEWSDKNLDMEKVEQCHAECHTFRDAVDTIMETFDDYDKARGPAYFPINKETLPSRFSDYLYNRHTGKSWFLQFLCVGAQTRTDATDAEYLSKLPKAFKKVVSDFDLEWNLAKIAKNVCLLSDWHKRTRGVLSRRTEYDWLVDEEDFWNSYVGILVDMIGTEQPRKGHFTVYGATHYNWMDAVSDRYDTDFNVLRTYKDEKERGYNR